MAKYTKPDMRDRWASAGNIATPTNEKIEEGWIEEIPPSEIANFIENRQDEALAYLMQQGIPEWEIGIEYQPSSFIQYAGVVYKALTINLGQQPNISPLSWTPAFDEFGSANSVQNALNTLRSEPNPFPQYAGKPNFDAHVAQNTVEYSNVLSLLQAVNQRVTNLEVREEVQIGEFLITDDPRNPVLYKGYGEWRLVPNVMLSGLDLGGITGQVRQIASGVGQNVRTTFFWRRIDPNSITPTRTVTIVADAVEVNLRTLFEAQYGVPVLGEQVKFVIADGVLITSNSTSNYAIVTGDWPPQTSLSMDNYGIIAGKGGEGGTGIGETTPPEAKHGLDGGSAILATYPLALNNLNTVAGGGGGGGASANWRATQGTASAHIGNVGGSGGAPFGEAGDLGVVNAGIINWGDGLNGLNGGRTIGGASVTRTESRSGVTLNHFGGVGGNLGQNGGNGTGSGTSGGGYTANEWRAGGVGGLAGVAVVGLVAVSGNPVLGR